MLIKERIDKYKELKKLDFQLNFLINKKEKEKLDHIADKNEISTSELIRILIKELINEQRITGEI